MPIELTVEDGTNVPLANSYVTVEEIVAYAASRGVTLPTDDEQIAILGIKACDYLESKGDLYQGTLTYEDQVLLHPRSGMIVNGVYIADNTIHVNLKKAQCALAIAVYEGVDLLPTNTAQDYITKEVIGPITTVFADPVSVGINAKVNSAESWLQPLYKRGSGGANFKSVRVC